MRNALPKDPLERVNFPQDLGDAFGPRSRRSGRALLHGLAAFGASIAIAGCHDRSADEITSSDYRHLAYQTLDWHPQIRPVVRRALADNKITYGELRQINQAATETDAARDRANIEWLKGTMK